MAQIIVPTTLDTNLYNTLREIVERQEDSSIPILTSIQQVQSIRNGRSAYYVDGNILYRYTKVGTKLFRETVADSLDPEAVFDAAENTPRIGYIEEHRGHTNVTTTELRSYQTTEENETEFFFKFYATSADLDNDNEVPEDERPLDLSFEPLTPIQDGNPHIVTISYQPIVTTIDQWFTVFGIE